MAPSEYQINNIVRSYSRKLMARRLGLTNEAVSAPQDRTKPPTGEEERHDLEVLDRITAGVVGSVASARSQAGQANRQALHRVAANLRKSKT